MRFAEVDQLLQRGVFLRRDQHIGRLTEHGDWFEIRQRISWLLHHVEVRCERAQLEQHSMSVRRRPLYGLGTDNCSRPGLVLDDDALSNDLAKFICENSAHRIRYRARREWHGDANR